MRIECIAIGTELLTTSRMDTNSVWLAERLAALGLRFSRKTCVGDDREDLRALCLEALERSDLIVCTGGLGPTFDDFTKELWAEILDAPLLEDAAARADLLSFFAARGREPSPSNFKQALIPEGAERLPNPIGSAPGILWENPKGHPGRRIVLLPGVPREMKRMWDEQVAPRLRALAAEPVRTLRLVVGGVPESTLGERTRALREKHAGLDWTILAPLTHVELLARSRDDSALEAARRDFEAELGEDLACVGEGSVDETVLDLLRRRGETLALAESMTGGLVASRLTALPGASEALLGGAVVYTLGAKAAFLELDPAFLAREGTVSKPVTAALARAVRERLGAAWGLAVTGNAGPTEDRDGASPVGTVIVAVAGPGGEAVRTFNLPGERAAVQLRGASWALDVLRRQLLHAPPFTGAGAVR